MQYGMIGYYVPHRLYPAGYHCDPRQPLPFAGLASQKNHMSLYLACAYAETDLARGFREAWARTGKKLDMGKSCIRFRSTEDLALEVIGGLLRRVTALGFIDHYESAIKATPRRPARTKSAKPARTQGATTLQRPPRRGGR
jgi:hypothetical protein